MDGNEGHNCQRKFLQFPTPKTPVKITDKEIILKSTFDKKNFKEKSEKQVVKNLKVNNKNKLYLVI